MRGSGGLCGPVIFAGHLRQFGFDRLPVRLVGFVGDLSEDLVAEVAFVPAFGPAQAVEEAVQFCLADPGTRLVPAALRAFFLRVVPVRAAFAVEGQFDQAKAHHQVAHHLGLIESSGEGPEFNPVLPAGEVSQVEQVVAVRLAALSGVVFVSVVFDLFRVRRLFAASRSGAGEDRPFVVADQADQSGEGGGVSVPFDRYVQSAGWVDSSSVFVDPVDRLFDLGEPCGTLQLRADKFAAFAIHRSRLDAAVAFGSPSVWQPRHLVTSVVWSDRCGFTVGEGGFEFNSEGDLVGVHGSFPVVWCVVWLEAPFASRVTHVPWVREQLKAFREVICSCFAAFFQVETTPVLAACGAVFRGDRDLASRVKTPRGGTCGHSPGPLPGSRYEDERTGAGDREFISAASSREQTLIATYDEFDVGLDSRVVDRSQAINGPVFRHRPFAFCKVLYALKFSDVHVVFQWIVVVKKDLRPDDAGRQVVATGSGGSQFEVTAVCLDEATRLGV